MAMDMDSLYALLLLAAAVSMAAVALNWLLGSGRRGGRMPPGSLGLPLVGESLRLIAAYRSSNPEPFMDERIARHGRLFTTHVFGERTVFSADPEFNRLVLAAEGRAVDCSYPSSISTLLGRYSLLLMKGHVHKRMHSLTLTRLGRPGSGGSPLLGQIERLVLATMREWEPTATVRLLEQAKRMTFTLTVKQLVSIDAGPWTENLRHEYVKIMNGFFSVPIPFASLLPFTIYGQAIKARKNVADALREVIRMRMKEKGAKGGEKEKGDGEKRYKKDMVEELMEAEGGSFSEEELVDFCLALLVGGYETSSVLITFAVKFLTETPAALAELKEEHERIRAAKGETVPLEWSDYKSMSFTQCVVNETLRMGNIIGGVFRRANEDIQFKGYTIPKGCKIFASFRSVHLNNEFYEDARTFNPWRWQSENLQSAVGSNLFTPSVGSNMFTPFGGGPRLCPGYEVARVIISVFLHHLVTRFTWEPAEEDRLIFFPTTRTLKGYPINVRRREKSIC